MRFCGSSSEARYHIDHNTVTHEQRWQQLVAAGQKKPLQAAERRAPQAGHSTKREPSSALVALSGALRRAALCSLVWLFLAACHQLVVLLMTQCQVLFVQWAVRTSALLYQR